jgi:molybdate transport system substrate-binding protein
VSSLRIISAIALRKALEVNLLPVFERATGFEPVTRWDPTKLIMESIARGDRADLVIMTNEAVDEMIDKNVLDGDSKVLLADAVLGLAVLKGKPKPDISTADGFRKTLLSAGRVAFSRSGASGIYFAKLIESLGIADCIRKTAVIVPSGFTADRLVSGEADLAVQQLSELMAVTGVDIVDPFPQEYQQVTRFAAACFAGAENPDAAKQLFSLLTSHEAAGAYHAAGLIPCFQAT